MTSQTKTIGLIGNPNCGKTTLFNALTRTRQQVGNWPGVTVERKSGVYGSGSSLVNVVDLPGVYSLGVTSFASVDERVAREFALSGEADLVVNIVDASNLERNLYLTAQIIEMRVPMIVVLNMFDVAIARRLEIDVAGLSRRLGCPVVPMVASRGEGLDDLKAEIARFGREPHPPRATIKFAPEIEAEIDALQSALAASSVAGGIHDLRWLAVKLLENDEVARHLVPAEMLSAAEAAQARITERLDEDADILIADARYGFANQIMRDLVRQTGKVDRTTSDKIDRIVLHRVLGLPIFLLVIYLLFLFSINFGSAFIDFFDQITGAFLVDGVASVLDGWGWPAWLVTLLAHGVGG
ncbi:MAG: ferrous iron transporter B, partial [Rhodospirillales bacterium]